MSWQLDVFFSAAPTRRTWQMTCVIFIERDTPLRNLADGTVLTTVAGDRRCCKGDGPTHCLGPANR